MTKVLFWMWGQSNVHFGDPNIPQIPHRSQPVSQSQNISREISYHPFLPNVPEWQYSRYLLEWRFFNLWQKYWVLDIFIIIEITDIRVISKLVNHFFILTCSVLQPVHCCCNTPFDDHLQFWKPSQITDLIRQRKMWVEIIVNNDECSSVQLTQQVLSKSKMSW